MDLPERPELLAQRLAVVVLAALVVPWAGLGLVAQCPKLRLATEQVAASESVPSSVPIRPPRSPCLAAVLWFQRRSGLSVVAPQPLALLLLLAMAALVVVFDAPALQH